MWTPYLIHHVVVVTVSAASYHLDGIWPVVILARSLHHVCKGAAALQAQLSTPVSQSLFGRLEAIFAWTIHSLVSTFELLCCGGRRFVAIF